MTTDKCPLSTHLYVGVAHPACQLTRDVAIDALLSVPVMPNMPSHWAPGIHQQHPSTVQSFKQLKSRWIYPQAGQNATSFDNYVSPEEQCKFRLDQVGRSNNEEKPPLGSIEPFVMIVPLLMTLSNDHQHVTPKRPQLWVSPTTLPFEEFKLLFTVSYSMCFKSSDSQSRLMSDSMRDIRRLVPTLTVNMPDTHKRVEGRYWLQEGKSNQYFVVGILAPIESQLRALYDQYIVNPPADSRMSWFFWQRHIDQNGAFRAQKAACDAAFVYVSSSLNAFIANNIRVHDESLHITPARLNYMPASTIFIDFDIRIPCIRYRCNAVSSSAWWVFPPVSEVDGSPSMYEFDDAEVIMQKLNEAWNLFGAMPLVYDTSRYNHVYAAFPFTPRPARPISIKLQVV